MGGFEGGDEGGFWDVDSISTLIDKQNMSKPKSANTSNIEKSDSGYSIKANSKDKEFYDTISFIPCDCKTFTIEGYDDIPTESNSIYKAFQALIDFTDDLDIEEFFHEHKVVVSRGIPSQADLDAGSSHAAAFILLTKEVCNLVLSSNELDEIGLSVGADVPFFMHKLCEH